MQQSLKLGFRPSAEQKQEFLARRHGADASGPPDNLAINGDTAEITVAGVLTAQPDFFSWLFGGGNTTYSDIQSALAIADKDPAVKRAVLKVDSPGGQVAGLFDAIASLQAFSKPMTVRASQACSAAFALAAAAGPIEAVGSWSEFGSIGVVCSYSFSSDEENIDITSTEAPDKRPDPRTPEGKAKIVEYLDALHSLFVGAIATGRTQAGATVDAATVNAEYGRGSVLLADEAKRRGMIDKAPKQAKPVKGARASAEVIHENSNPAPVATDTAPVTAQQRPRAQEKTLMNKTELKAAHPELYAAVMAEGKAEAVAEATASERKRVGAHLKMGRKCGAMDVAEKAIASGASVTDDDVFADYQTAAIDNRDKANRQADSDAVGEAVKNAKSGSGAPAGAPGAAPSASAEDGEDPPLLAAAADIYCGPRKTGKKS